MNETLTVPDVPARGALGNVWGTQTYVVFGPGTVQTEKSTAPVETSGDGLWVDEVLDEVDGTVPAVPYGQVVTFHGVPGGRPDSSNVIVGPTEGDGATGAPPAACALAVASAPRLATMVIATRTELTAQGAPDGLPVDIGLRRGARLRGDLARPAPSRDDEGEYDADDHASGRCQDEPVPGVGRGRGGDECRGLDQGPSTWTVTVEAGPE